MKVGIFFKVENEFLTDTVPVAAGEAYREPIQHGGHYEYHETLIANKPLEHRFKARDYDFFIRVDGWSFSRHLTYIGSTSILA